MKSEAKRLPDLSRTEEAIRERDAAWKSYEDLAHLPPGGRIDWKAEMAKMDAAERAVGEAYGEDTKDRNNPGDCARLIRAGDPADQLQPGYEISFVRRMVALWKERNS